MWSSTEYSADNAINFNYNGNVNNNNKSNDNNNQRVRAFLALYIVIFMDKFNEVIPLEDIIEAYHQTRRHKRYKVDHLEFESNLYSNLVKLWVELNNGTYHPSTSKCFVVTKPKPREIIAASFRDRIVHHWIVNKLMPLLEDYFIDNTFSCRVGKGNIYGVNALKSALSNSKSDYYVAKLDIRSFFMSINKTLLVDKLIDFIELSYSGTNKSQLVYYTRLVMLHCPQNDCIVVSKKLRELVPIDKTLSYQDDNHGLPIGNLTSQIAANFYFTIFDTIMVDIFGSNYGRYVDDFYLIGDKSLILKVIKYIEGLLSLYDLELHKDKRYLQPIDHGCIFLGYEVYPDRVYIINRTINNIRHKLDRYNEGKLSSGDIIKSINSTLGMLIHADTYNIRKSLLGSIDLPHDLNYSKLTSAST